ncbi:phosphodiester glycosidase family protein [Streptomyces sp. UNOB3_S3]|uniref:phosphodiester glycosidase family protein n=1 Tax=Streptomyces sp. UNOB3_S3 TaxID=2871682 RepID=UPI001E57DEE4|nr:phosphodiester glycosidase family protein [Streptomyces sp. UNOB3_S3]MCC3774651.1 phosphodiester glycosidase family protein [Streptomyces sp. UNOB3_S3]
MKIRRMRRSALTAGLAVLTLVLPAMGLQQTRAVAQPAVQRLPLGDANLPETRTATQVAPGVTWTRIKRGRPDARDHWTVEVALLKDESAARSLADRLDDAGFEPVVGRVDERPQDLPSKQPWGWRVRVGELADKAAADQLVKDLRVAGFRPTHTYFTGEDGTGRTGPWVVDVLKVSAAQRQRVQVRQSLDRVPGGETLADMVKHMGGIAGINGSYGSDEEDGTFGDVAGLSVVGGKLVSEAVQGTSALVLPSERRARPSVQRLSTNLRLRSADGAQRELDGLNRSPGKIRNCGGTGGDVPTERPRHDALCTDDSEVIQYTDFFHGPVHAGDGAAVVLDKNGRVLETRDRRGGTFPSGTTLLAGTGDGADWLRAHARKGQVVTVTAMVVDRDGRPLTATAGRGMDVASGGPQLLKDGRIDIPAEAEGFNYPDDPGFFDYFGTHRHPRSLAGVTADGSLLFVAVDGRRPGYSSGLSFRESAAVMRSLGAVDALNLDGGGSTTMVVGGRLVNRPSDSTGPRLMANALIIH